MKYYGTTNRGLLRRSNQDSYVIAANEHNDVFAIVCDGIGGNQGGDVASRMAVAYFSKAFSENTGFADEKDAGSWIQKTASEANTAIYEYGQSHEAFRGMGTTFCGALICGNTKYIVNIGDSRAYAFWKDGRLELLTRDHTLVNDMLLHDELTKEEAANYPRKNVLTNALGVWENVRCDITTRHDAMSGILLCSDGLHAYVDEEVIKKIVLNEAIDPTLRARRLIKAALDTGGYDNVTVVLIDFESGDDNG